MTDTTEGSQSKTGALTVAFADQPRASSLATIRNLAWLVRRVVRAAPRAAFGWLVLSLGLGMVVPIELWATKGVADNLQARLDGGDGGAMWWFAGVWMAISLASVVMEPFEDRFRAIARERGGAAVAAEALDKATWIDLASYEHQPFYDRIAIVLNTAEERAHHILLCLIQLGWAVPRMVTWLGVLIAYDWRLALLAIVPVVPAIYGFYFTGTRYYELWSEQTRERRLADYYAGLLSDRQAAKEIRLFGLAPTLLGRWEELYWEAARRLRSRIARVGLKQRGLSLASFTLSLLGLAWYASTGPEIPSAGTIVIVIASYFGIYGGVFNLAQPFQEVGKQAGFARDARIFLNLPDERDVRTNPVSPAPTASELVLEHVTFSYPGATEPVLKDISLRIAPGQTVALVGENGAGKTTLIKLMLGLYQPDSGRVLLDGEDLATADPAAIRARLSGVFQHFTRYPLTLRDNVTLGETRLAVGVADALAIVGLAKLPERLPEGLDTVLAPDLGGVDLSGGQWQRLAIARAGIRKATLVALDEPTAALDPLAEVAIFERFADLAADRTTILVSHRLGIARLADRIVTLEHGRVVEEGSHNALLARDGSHYAEMWEAQARWYR